MTELGGFFASLKLKTDTASFATGKKHLDEFQKSTKDLKKEYGSTADSIVDKTMKMGASFMGLAGSMLKMAVGLEAALAAFGVASAKSASQLSTQGFKANMTASMAHQWELVSKLAGGNSAGLLGEMGSVNQALQNVQFGNADSYAELLKNLSFMGMTKEGLKAFAEKGKSGNVNDLMVEVMKSAGSQMGTKDKDQKVYQEVLNAFGPETANIIAQASIQKKSPMQLYNEAAGINMRSAAGLGTSADTNAAFNKTMASLEEVMASLGDKINKTLGPALKDLNNWFLNNKDNIDKWTTNIANAFAGIFNVFDAMAKNPVFQALANSVGIGAGAITTGLAGGDANRQIGNTNPLWRLKSTGEWDEATAKNTAYDLGLSVPGLFDNPKDSKFSKLRDIEKGYASGKEFTLNITVDGKTQTYKIDPNKGTETLLNGGATR